MLPLKYGHEEGGSSEFDSHHRFCHDDYDVNHMANASTVDLAVWDRDEYSEENEIGTNGARSEEMNGP